MESEQRSRLLLAKLRALVDERWGHDPERQGVAFSGGAGIVRERTAWMLLDGVRPALGGVLAWAARHDVDVVHALADHNAGTLARRAALFVDAPHVWQIVAGAVEPAVASEPIPQRRPAESALACSAALEGLDIVVEHGEIFGELLGLEVARVVVDEHGVARVEVGVGRHDRELFAMLHGDLPREEAVRNASAVVRGERRQRADAHPLARLAPERWLRSHLLADPARLVGWRLEPVEGPEPRGSLSDVSPAVAMGVDVEGAPVVLACSVGIDLDLVPVAADARLRHEPAARLVLALPARDAHAVTRQLAAGLRNPAEVLAIEGDWRR